MCIAGIEEIIGYPASFRGCLRTLPVSRGWEGIWKATYINALCHFLASQSFAVDLLANRRPCYKESGQSGDMFTSSSVVA